MPDYVPYNTVDECLRCQKNFPVRKLKDRLCPACRHYVLTYDYDVAVRDLEHEESEEPNAE